MFLKGVWEVVFEFTWKATFRNFELFRNILSRWSENAFRSRRSNGGGPPVASPMDLKLSKIL